MGDKTQIRSRNDPIRVLDDENSMMQTYSSIKSGAFDSENKYSARSSKAAESPITPGSVLSNIENSRARSEYVKDFPLKITKARKTKPATDNSEEIKQLKKVIAEEQANAKKYKSDMVNLRDKLKSQMSLNDKQSREIEQLSKAVTGYETDINSLLKTKNCLVNDIQDLQNQILQLRNTHENEVKRLQAHISLLTMEKPNIPENAVIPELERAKEQISTLQNDYDKAFKQVRKELAQQKQVNSQLAKQSEPRSSNASEKKSMSRTEPRTSNASSKSALSRTDTRADTRTASEKKIISVRTRPSSGKRGRSFLGDEPDRRSKSRKAKKGTSNVRRTSSVRRVSKSKSFRR